MPALAKALADRDPAVRQAAVKALGAIGPGAGAHCPRSRGPRGEGRGPRPRRPCAGSGDSIRAPRSSSAPTSPSRHEPRRPPRGDRARRDPPLPRPQQPHREGHAQPSRRPRRGGGAAGTDRLRRLELDPGDVRQHPGLSRPRLARRAGRGPRAPAPGGRRPQARRVPGRDREPSPRASSRTPCGSRRAWWCRSCAAGAGLLPLRGHARRLGGRHRRRHRGAGGRGRRRHRPDPPRGA